jgi:large conductance mechanosensitive channel
VTIGYGQFINDVIAFLIVAFCVFLVVKGYNAMMRKEEPAPAAPPEPSAEAKLRVEIRDLLAAKV